MMIITAMLMGGMFLFISLYLQIVAGLTPFAAGLWLVPQMIAMIIGTLLAPVLARRLRPGLLVTGGVLVTGLGFVVLTQTSADGGLLTVVARMPPAPASPEPRRRPPTSADRPVSSYLPPASRRSPPA